MHRESYFTAGLLSWHLRWFRKPDNNNVAVTKENMVHPGGFEPPTARFVAEYSIQLSYGCIGITAVILISNFAICHSYQRMVHPGGFEPPTARFVAEYSIQLSYGCIGKLALLRVSVTTNTCHTEYDGLIGRVTRLCLALRAAAFTAFFSLNSERRWCIREDSNLRPLGS